MDALKIHRAGDDKSKKHIRKRVPISCYMCRVKKSKCDRAKPYCSNCVSKDIIHLCKYEENISEHSYLADIERNKLLEEIESLKAKMKILEEHSTLNSATNKNSIDDSDMCALDMSDCLLSESSRKTAKFDYIAVKNLKLRYFGMSSYVFVLLNDPYSRRTFESYLQHQVSTLRKSKNTKTKINIEPSKKAITLSTQITENFALKSDDNCLPSPFIMRVLVDRFINYCHHMLPFLSREFLISILDLIIKQDTGDIKTLSERYPCELSILILTLRFATLTLPLKSYFAKKLTSSMHRFVEDIIQTNGTVSPSHIELVNKILLSMDQFRKSDALTLKALLFLYIYKVYSPEDEENGSDLSILLGIIIQICRMIGAHKYFVNLDNEFIENQDIKDFKCILSCLYYYDSRQSFRMGTPLLFTEEGLYRHILSEKIEEKNSNNAIRNEYFKTKEKLMKFQRLAVKVMNGENFVNLENNLNYIANEFKAIYLTDLRNLESTFMVKRTNSLDNVVERVESIYCKTELLFNMYIIYSALYVINENEDEKLRYLSLAFGRALLIMINGYKFAKGEISDYFSEYEILYASSIWIPMQKTLPLISSCMNRLLDGKFSLSKFYSFMDPREVNLLLNWPLLDFSSDINFCKSLFRILEGLYQSSLRLSTSYLSCFKATLVLKSILDYFRPKIVRLCDSSLEIIADSYNNIPYDSHLLDDFFENHTNKATHDFNFFDETLYNYLSPFLETNYESLDSFSSD